MGAAAGGPAGRAPGASAGHPYGAYLAQGFGLRHPDRVAGMVLDSPLLGPRDLAVQRAHIRALLWDGAAPDTARPAALLRALVADGLVAPDRTGAVVPLVYEFAGPRVLARLLTGVREGRTRAWEWCERAGAREIDGPGTGFLMETDLVAGISHGELHYGAPPDGLPLDPQVMHAAMAATKPRFTGEPYDLPSALPAFDWPTAVVSGGRDVRTPRPVAERVAELAPDAVLVPLPGMGHSALDTHPLAALHVAHAVAAGAHRRLPGLAPRIAALPRRAMSGHLGSVIAAGLALERWAPRRALADAPCVR
ncbi:alpha/beta hydrolase [Pseudonocardia sp. DSM 110487]|uniref:alpha/beta fold hydrolase n=1 Tax=Pseudonocardia sp. DSM 110487 TaxID=2865833 RepID=UPI001C6A025B|nr:alpha/beta hydrolase [Pseudonocardia sp. DSM 110487]QYN38618.1 alpha/beta hydrolase [Pseudonocardia sp. DSM 110487]